MSRDSRRKVRRIKNERFEQQVIHLDNDSYIDCAFIECHVVYLGATEVSLIGCSFDNCTWGFDGPAASVIRFMHALYAMGQGGAELIEKTFANIREGKFPVDPKNPAA